MVEDLSEHHRPLAAQLPPCSEAESLRRYALTGEQVEFFRCNGYLTGVRVLSQDRVETLLSELAEISRPGHAGEKLFYEFHSNESKDPSRVLFHALGAWRIMPGFHDLLWNASFLVPAYQLLGGPVRFFHDQLFCKPAESGGVVAWHQDYSYWTRTRPLAHLSCWIALDDSDEDNGCLHYVKGSHDWGLLPITGLAGDMDAIHSVLSPEQKAAFHPVPIKLRAGEASFHHALMVHGSFENRSERPRRATVLNVFRDGVVSDTDEPLLEGVPRIIKGQKIEGRFFPLLFPESQVEP